MLLKTLMRHHMLNNVTSALHLKASPFSAGMGRKAYCEIVCILRDVLEDESLEWTRLMSTRHAEYWCAYHLVWIPKYRRDILVGGSALCPPRHPPAYIANYLKGKSGRGRNEEG
jgi:hypothetical protein